MWYIFLIESSKLGLKERGSKRIFDYDYFCGRYKRLHIHIPIIRKTFQPWLFKDSREVLLWEILHEPQIIQSGLHAYFWKTCSGNCLLGGCVLQARSKTSGGSTCIYFGDDSFAYSSFGNCTSENSIFRNLAGFRACLLRIQIIRRKHVHNEWRIYSRTFTSDVLFRHCLKDPELRRPKRGSAWFVREMTLRTLDGGIYVSPSSYHLKFSST